MGKYQVEKCKSSSSFVAFHFDFLSQIDVFLIYIGDDPSYDGLC